MPAPKFYQQFFSLSLAGVDKRRQQTVSLAVQTLMLGAKATLTSLGRCLSGRGTVKNKIKRMDRLLGNQHLYAELPTIYSNTIKTLVRLLPECVIAVDWSCYPDERYSMLRASLVYHGRSLPLMSVVVEKRQESNSTIHRQFLGDLKTAIGDKKPVTLVSDAGFQTTWFKAVSDLGWFYVGRIRGNIRFKLTGHGQWETVNDYSHKKAPKARYLGAGLCGRHTKSQCQSHFYHYSAQPKGRSQGKYKKNNSAKSTAKGHKESWLLVSNVAGIKANKLVNVYKCRMQIEQNFRDEKSVRYGLSLRESKSQGTVRLSILCLLTVLASILLWLYGFYLEQQKIHLAYQANTEKRRVLSFMTLARNVLYQQGLTAPPLKWYNKLLRLLSTHYVSVVYDDKE